MKYIRKTVVIVLAIIFFIALAICAAVGTMIKKINITYTEGTGEGYEAYLQTVENLQDLKGGNIFLLSDGDVSSCVDSSRLNLVSYKKSFPCTLEISISERIETYYSYSDGVCYVYDEEGVLMYSSEDYESDGNGGYVVSGTNDLSPNVGIEHDITKTERAFIASSCATFKQSFGALRGIVESVYRENTRTDDNLVFEMRSGLVIEIGDCGSRLDEKIVKAYACYLTLSDGQKTDGKIRVYTEGGTESAVQTVYIP